MKHAARIILSSFLMAVALAALSLVAARPCAATTAPYVEDSYQMTDPLGGSWWRDTTNQNAIAQYTYDEGLDTVEHPYTSPDGTLDVYEYVAPWGHANENVVVITTPTSYFLVDFGGSDAGAAAAKAAFTAAIPGFANRQLVGVALAGGANAGDGFGVWGGQQWGPTCNIGLQYPVLYIPGTWPADNCNLGTPVPVYVNAGWDAVVQRDAWVQTAVFSREKAVQGALLSTGADGFLGPESFPLTAPSSVLPTLRVPSDSTLNFTLYDHATQHTLELISVMSDSDAGLVIWIPDAKTLIADSPFFDSFPSIGSLIGPPRSAEEMVSDLNTMLHLQADNLIYVHGLPVTGALNVSQALTNQKGLVNYVFSETVRRINLNERLDDIVTAVTASAQNLQPFASSPYVQQIEADVPSAVRGIYHYYMGWFDGDPVELTSTLTYSDKAQMMADLAGGVANLTDKAKSAELAAQTLPSAEQALFLAQAAYQAGGGTNATAVYIQALTKCAYMQKSSQKRYYYLTFAQNLGSANWVDTPPVVVNQSYTVNENTGLTIDAPGVLAGASDQDGDTLSAQASSQPSHGSLSLNADGSFTYTPAYRWYGTDSFTFQATDGQHLSNTGTVTVSVAAVNHPPVAVNDSATTAKGSKVTIDVLANDYDPDGDTLTVTAVTQGTYGKVTINDDGTLTYYPADNFTGTDTFTYIVTDPGGLSATATVTVTVIK